jgi:hypothetical protein
MKNNDFVFKIKILEHTAKCYFRFTGGSQQHMLEQGVRVRKEILEAWKANPSLHTDKWVLKELKSRPLLLKFKPLLIKEAKRQKAEQRKLLQLEEQRKEEQRAEAKRKEEELNQKLYSKFLEGFDNETD